MNKVINGLNVEITGAPSNRSVIFIHGFPFDLKMWNNQIKDLEENFYCVCYDVRGLGNSPAGSGQFTIEGFCDDLFEVCHTLNLEKPVVCGLSMGGYIALRAIEREKEFFSGAILCDTKSEADTNEAKIKRANGVKAIDQIGLENFVNEFVPNCFAETSKGSETYNQILSRSRQSDEIGVKGCLIAMAGRTDTSEFLNNLKLPVVLICGEQDSLTPPQVMQKMAERIKNSQFHIVPDAGHLAPAENSTYVNKVIKDFLNTLAKSK